ncbi:MAG TPA: hypothetical protein CFH84_02450 [Sulfurimonas sp. UBA12504]|nr:MAG: hypothetical protein A2019_01250 [Sulfurimonas sp. GWF2_37_8]DAB30730.1 MAG TPA: hypothetical protein CFH84_02450 [Sulfurimonas sp. UBA12504]
MSLSSLDTPVLRNRLVHFDTFEAYFTKRIFPNFITFSYIGLFLAALYLFFDYHTYVDTMYIRGVIISRFIAIFFAIMVVVASQSKIFEPYRIEAITFFGTMGYTAITYSYIAYDNVIYFVGFNWIFYLVATIMLTPLISKKLYVFMESFQIMAVLVLMYIYYKPFDMLFTYTVFSIPLAFYVYAVVSLNRKNGLEAYENAYNMHILSSIDGLSHLLNRRSWYEISKKLFSQQNNITFIMLDIDYFKKINDTYGHDAGDMVIQTVSRILLEQTRQQDLIGRLGGEEFGIMLPHATLSETHIIAERIRMTIEKTQIHYNEETLNITVSLGVSEKSPTMKDLSMLVTYGDQLLYQAKEKGRNRVVVIAG